MVKRLTVFTRYIPAKQPAWLLFGKNDIKHAPSKVGISTVSIANHRGYPFAMAQVVSMVAAKLTTPDGMFSSALCLLVYPKSLIRVDEKVVITPLGMVVRIVSRTSSQVCRSHNASSSELHLKTLWPTPAVSSCSLWEMRSFSA